MTSYTVTPAFPGDFAAYADQAPDLTTAYRVRKPNRRKGSVTAIVSLLLAAILAVLALSGTRHAAPAFYGLTPGQVSHVATALDRPAAHLDAYTATPAQEEAACAAVMHFHHANAAGWMDGTWGQQQAWQAAWHHAWHAAMHADPAMRADIHRYLFTDSHWMAAYIDCGYGS